MYEHLAYLFYLSNYIINCTEFHPPLLKHTICFLRSRERFMICKVASLLKLQHVNIIVSTKKHGFSLVPILIPYQIQNPSRSYRRLAYLKMSLWHPIPSHLYLRILNFLSHPCNHHNPTSTSIRNASKAFGSEDFAKMLLIFL